MEYDLITIVAIAAFALGAGREALGQRFGNAALIGGIGALFWWLDATQQTVLLWLSGLIFLSVTAAGAVGWVFRRALIWVSQRLDGKRALFGRTEQGERPLLRTTGYTNALKGMPLTAAFGLFVLVCCMLMVFFADWIAPFGEREVVGDVWQLSGTACKSEAGEGTCVLGTDNLGRDMLSRLIYGAQTTISVALAAGVLSFLTGMILSFTAAVTGGWVDQVLSRFNDLLLAIPTLIFALVVLAALPQTILILVLVMALIDQTRVFRLGRAVAVDVVVQDFVEAARLRGEGWSWIIFREVLPNVLTPLIAEFGLRFAFAVLFLSTLSFLGLGIQPPEADWGGMVKDNNTGIIFLVPAALYPGAAIALLAVCVNMVVDWLLNRTASLKGGRG